MKYENCGSRRQEALIDSGTAALQRDLSLLTSSPSMEGGIFTPRTKNFGLLLVLAALFVLGTLPARAVTAVASNLRVSVSGGTAILRWSGDQGVLYQAEGATTPGGAWQAIGAPTSSFAVTNVLTGPAQFYRVGIYTNTTIYTANAARNTGDKAAPTVPSGVTGRTPNCSQVNLSWNASTDQGTTVKVGGRNVTYTSGLKGYNLYRNGVFLTQVLAPATSASDTSAASSTG